MALSGDLTDLSLAELIEFFGNLRKTGRLKVEYAEAPGVFYFNEGDLVDAQVGQRIGAEAIYYALSLPNASFDFNTHIYASRRTINEPWMRLVLEGLRRMDEGIAPEAEIPADDQTSEESADELASEASVAEVVAYMDNLHRLEDGTWAITSSGDPNKQINQLNPAPRAPQPFQQAVGTTAGNRRKVLLLATVAAFLVCGTAVGALTNWFGKGGAPAVTSPTTSARPIQPTQATSSSVNTNLETAAGAPMQSERQAAASERRGAAKPNAARNNTSPAARDARAAAATANSKTVIVQVMVDEGGRVSQASISNARPGMESYEASALRIARQRRYPAGKSGVISVPVKIN